MKGPATIFCLAILSTIILSCSQNAPVQPPASEKVPAIQQPKEKITLNLIGEILFDRSFNDAQFLKTEKEIDEYYKRQEKTNPVLMPPGEKNDLRNKFQNFGFVKGEELLLSKLKFESSRKFQLENLPGNNPLHIIFKQNKEDDPQWKLIIASKKDTVELKLSHFMELKYKLLDIVPGGYKEIVLLNEHYLSNHELYTFSVYEVKTYN